MIDSLQALQIIFENYPDFLYLSDYHYDPPESEVLLCVEMNQFAKYVWELFLKDSHFDFYRLRLLLLRLIQEGNKIVEYSVKLCFNESLDSLDNEAENVEFTRRWLIELDPILINYDSFAEKKRKYLGTYE